MTPSELKLRCAPIIDAAGEVYEVDRVLILGKSGRQHIVAARSLAMYLCYRLTGASTPQLAPVFGKVHSTVLRSITIVEKRYESSPLFARKIHSMIRSLSVAMERAA